MLQICRKLFDSFNKSSINYVMIKSLEGEEFLKATNGLKDIDLLIASKDKRISERILCDLGFKKVLFPKEFDGVGFYIGFDIETKGFILIHIHNKLRFGNRLFNEFHLKIEEEIFKEGRNLLEKERVYTLNLEYEFYTLLVRTVLVKKYKQKDLQRLNFLSKKLKKRKIKDPDFIMEMFGGFGLFLEIDYNSTNAKKLHKKYYKRVKKYLTKTLEEKSFRLLRFFHGLWAYKVSIFCSLLDYPKYVIRKKGKMVAFQGVDGSGKSTQIDKILKIKYFQITGLKRFYGGNNEYWIPGLCKACYFLENKKNIYFKIFKAIISVLCIIDRRLRLLPAFWHILKGKIVIFDRYFYDDLSYLPRLKIEKAKIGRMKWIAKKIFMSHLLYTPHLTIFLNIEPAIAYKRKQEFPLRKLEVQIEAYREVFKGREEVKIVDASNSLEKVSKEILALMQEL